MLRTGRPSVRARSPAARSPASISAKIRAASQRRWPAAARGGYWNRLTSSSRSSPGATPARNTRPLPAPRSTAANRASGCCARSGSLDNSGGDAGAGGPLLGLALPVAAGPEGPDGIDRAPRARPSRGQDGRYVGGEGLLDRAQGHEGVALLLGLAQGRAVDEVGLHVRAQQLHRARHERLRGVG